MGLGWVRFSRLGLVGQIRFSAFRFSAFRFSVFRFSVFRFSVFRFSRLGLVG